MNSMKNSIKAFLIIAALLVFSGKSDLYAQENIRELDVDGLKVFIKNTGKDVMSARLFIRGGTANYTLDKQGIEWLTYAIVVNGGTKSMPKSDFLAAAEKMGTNFGSDATLDYGELNMLCLKESWDRSWSLFADAILNPAFTPDEFANKKEQYISYAKQNESDPDYRLEQLTLTTTFKGKNYEKNPNGTVESFTAMTLDDIKTFYKENICKSRAFLVVAGNVDENDIIAKVKSSLASLPQGTPVKEESKTKIEIPGQDIVDRNISTNYLCGIMSGIPWDSPDAVAMMVAMNIMYDKYFVELRTKRGLSYAPAAYMNGLAISNPYSIFYISTDHPKDAIQVMVDVLNDVRKNGFTTDELKDSKNSYLTTHFMRLETAATQTLHIGIWNLRGNIGAFDNFENLVDAVSIQDINRVFTSNTGSIKWTYLGDPTKVTPEDFKQIEKIGF